MNQRQPTIFRRFILVISGLILVMGALFMAITYFATNYYHEASTQLLNRDVAAHIAKFTSPFTTSGINKQKADSVFQDAMVLSPTVEVYFLDTTGKVVYFHSSEKEIKEWQVGLAPIQQYIASNGADFLKGIDPKDPDHPKIFSAAEVPGPQGSLGYIYVILDSKKSQSIIGMISGSHIMNLLAEAFVVIILLSFLFSFIYLKRTSKNYQRMINVLQRFENGDYEARFDIKPGDELEPVTNAFNKMANLLASSINKLTRSEQERKNFIATISHDLRTPLSIARGYTETLLLKKGTTTPDEQEHYSKLILNKIFQIEHLANQLFELSKMDAVEFRAKLEPFVLSEVVHGAIDTFQPKASAKKIGLTYSGPNNMVWIKADVALIERVVQNLVDNAIKNTPEAGTIQVSMAVDSSRASLRIENSGKPLSPDLLQWVNHVGDEIPSAAKRPHKSGLGLMIVERVLRLHHTSLRAFTESGKNVFCFDLPLHGFPA